MHHRGGTLAVLITFAAFGSRLAGAADPAGTAAPLVGLVAQSDQVSDPGQDFLLSRLGGFAQTESATAWCGSNVVIGFTDGGSVLESQQAGEGQSLLGYARSEDAGEHFTDLGRIAAPSPSQILGGGGAAMACTSSADFFLATELTDGGSVGLAVSRSVDGGKTFGTPTPLALEDASSASFRSVRIAAEPGTPGRVYVAYIHSQPMPSFCGAQYETVEVIRTIDGGVTWTPPVVAWEGCGRSFTNVQVAAGAGLLYVTGEQLAEGPYARSLVLARSTDGGATFRVRERVASLTPPGGFDGSALLQGGIALNDLSALAADFSGGRFDGSVYLVTSQGTLPILDPWSVSGAYVFSDIVLWRSRDKGLTFERTPIRVNGGVEKITPTVAASDQFQPAIAVDSRGVVAICYYDRRRDRANYLMDRYCARSSDGGGRWVSRRISKASFQSVAHQDFVLDGTFYGQRDTLAADALGSVPGFIGGYTDTRLGTDDIVVNRP